MEKTETIKTIAGPVLFGFEHTNKWGWTISSISPLAKHEKYSDGEEQFLFYGSRFGSSICTAATGSLEDFVMREISILTGGAHWEIGGASWRLRAFDALEDLRAGRASTTQNRRLAIPSEEAVALSVALNITGKDRRLTMGCTSASDRQTALNLKGGCPMEEKKHITVLRRTFAALSEDQRANLRWHALGERNP